MSFGANDGVGTPTAWSYLTPNGDDVLVKGAGMTFDAAGRPTAGAATSIEIDVGNDNSAPELVITGISVAAARLDDGPDSFWRLLDGDDVILGPEVTRGASEDAFIIFGDGIAARTGATGGSDTISTGDGDVIAYGDVQKVGSLTAGAPTVDYRGGDDEILGLAGDLSQSLYGDVGYVYGGRLTGGDDNILIQSRSVGSSVAGDASSVVGRDGVVSNVVGGNDRITAGPDFRGILVGDVFTQDAFSFVQAGADTINGGNVAEFIVGDVYEMFYRTSRLIGGNDTINGGGGNDLIAGDLRRASSDSTVTGGHDVIRGGAGDDTIHGDAISAESVSAIVVGGNDRLYGEDGIDHLYGGGGGDFLDGGAGSDRLLGDEGNDQFYGGADGDALYGGAGNDLLDGGMLTDYLEGGTGNDTYFINSVADTVKEDAGSGIDTVWSTLGTTYLAANAENLSYNGVGNFTGNGNELANTITGGAGADTLNGGDGNDILIGGAGADVLNGGNGVDTASYSTASAGVDARLTGNSLNFGGDARGDTYSGVENLTGSAFQDNLLGDNLTNTLNGGAGGDNLFGLGGNDLLIGGDGSDFSLHGDAGNDVLRGGLGADHLFGGLGNDFFDFDTVADSAPGARDIVRADGGAIAFEGAGMAGGDRIDLAGIDANTIVGGNQAFVFGGTGIGRVSAVTSGTDTLIRGNTDNDAAFEFALLIEDGGVLASAYRAGDFML